MIQKAAGKMMQLPQWYTSSAPNPYKAQGPGPQDPIGPDGNVIVNPVGNTRQNDPLFASAFNKAKLRRI